MLSLFSVLLITLAIVSSLNVSQAVFISVYRIESRNVPSLKSHSVTMLSKVAPMRLCTGLLTSRDGIPYKAYAVASGAVSILLVTD